MLANLIDVFQVDPLVEVGWFPDLLPPALVVETDSQVPICTEVHEHNSQRMDG